MMDVTFSPAFGGCYRATQNQQPVAWNNHKRVMGAFEKGIYQHQFSSPQRPFINNGYVYPIVGVNFRNELHGLTESDALDYFKTVYQLTPDELPEKTDPALTPLATLDSSGAILPKPLFQPIGVLLSKVTDRTKALAAQHVLSGTQIDDVPVDPFLPKD